MADLLIALFYHIGERRIVSAELISEFVSKHWNEPTCVFAALNPRFHSEGVSDLTKLLSEMADGLYLMECGRVDFIPTINIFSCGELVLRRFTFTQQVLIEQVAKRIASRAHIWGNPKCVA